MLYLTGICISLFLGLLLIGKKDKTHADKILTIWLFILCLHMFLYYFSFSDRIQSYPFLFGLHFPMPLLHGPFLFLYTGKLTKNIAVNKKINLLHFIPVLIFYLLYMPFYLLPYEQKISIVENGGDGFQPIYSISIVAIIISGIVYVILSSILLHKHRRTILNQFSYVEKINLRWLQYLTYGIGLIWVFIIFSHDEIIFSAAALFIIFIGYFGIKQVGIFTQSHVLAEGSLSNSDSELPRNKIEKENLEKLKHASVNNEEVNHINEKTGERNRDKKYSKSGLTIDSANQLHLKLIEIMNSEKLFKESDLTLAQLAKCLNTHPNYLSQVINEKEGKNFFDYINTLRTREFIEIVSNYENQKYTLLGLAYVCGFNSKSSFNKYFRKVAGQSPLEYLNAIKAKKT